MSFRSVRRLLVARFAPSARRPALLGALAACAACLACGRDPTPSASIRTERLAAVHRIAAACRLPDSALELIGTEELQFRPPPDASYQSLDCVFRQLKRADLPLKMGFVGNEAYGPGNQQ